MPRGRWLSEMTTRAARIVTSASRLPTMTTMWWSSTTTCSTEHLNFVYRIEVTPVLPSLTLSLPERIQYVPVTVSVPRGNRMAVLVSAARANFGGDLTITPGGTASRSDGERHAHECESGDDPRRALGRGRCTERRIAGRFDWAVRPTPTSPSSAISRNARCWCAARTTSMSGGTTPTAWRSR